MENKTSKMKIFDIAQKSKISDITKEKIEKYLNLTETALKEAKKSINSKKKNEADKILEMVSCYLADSKYFEKEGNYVNAFACINYAHGWLDSGSRLGIFKVKDNKLFVLE